MNFYFDEFFFQSTAPPEITVDKSWVHASEGFDVELVCIVKGDVNSEVYKVRNFH